jgi:hypothetical protein
MSRNIFYEVKHGLQHRLADVVQELLPGGRIAGKEYFCASLQGGNGDSCRTNLETGVGSDFATDDTWPDVIGLAAKVWKVRQHDAAKELCKRYGIMPGFQPSAKNNTRQSAPFPFSPILPVPPSAPEPPHHHSRYGQACQMWCYQDTQGRTLAYAARFELATGKAILPLCYGKEGDTIPQWMWKSLPEPRPLYGLSKLTAMTDAPVLLVEGEKTADAAQKHFPHCAVLTWSGGANAIDKADFSPLLGRKVIIWPDNDAPGINAGLQIAALLDGKAVSVHVVQLPDTLPEKWDLADPVPADISPQSLLDNAPSVHEFRRKTLICSLGRSSIILPESHAPDLEDFTIKEWPQFSWEACPGLLGEFVKLAIKNSEADPAAVCITALVRFGAEVYGHVPNQGPHIYVGETIHPPRLFAVICGNSSKARKGTSRHPVTKFFGREYCQPSDLLAWGLPLPARESGGPLSTGEGLAHHVRDETNEDRERRQRQNPNEPIREKGDKRLIILDEEFASGLACTKREGNTLSMGIRCFWDSGDYAPLTKNNPVLVKGAHISILTHITMQELAVCLGEVQAVNGFGNRFLWICARRAKLVAMPSRMPEAELAPLQRELWRLVGLAQKRGVMRMNRHALDLWEQIYPELSQEHTGLAGGIINRAEAQTLRLALIYSLLDGQEQITKAHLQAALVMWRYAQDSALYIFGDKAIDPLEEKVLEALKQGPLTGTELSAALNRHVPRERLQPLLQQLEAQQRINIQKQKNPGRPRIIISLRELCEKREKSEEIGRSK